jgi:hypothetical protein
MSGAKRFETGITHFLFIKKFTLIMCVKLN